MSKKGKFTFTQWDLAFFSFIFLFLSGLNYLSNWWVFRVSGSEAAKVRESANFSDLQAIVSFIPCYRNVGNSIYLFDNYSPCHKGYIYGTPLLDFFSAIRLDAIPIFIVGSVLTIIFCLGLALIASKVFIEGRVNPFFIVGSIFSPGIWLLLERTNLDIFIFLMLLVATQLFSKGHEVSAILVVSLSAVFKFYTLPVLLVLFLITNKKSTRIILAVTGLLVLPKVYLDISSITNPGFPSTWYISFGSESFGLYLNLLLEQFGKQAWQLSSLQIKLLGYLAVLVTVFFLTRYLEIKSIATSNFLLRSPDGIKSDFLINSFWIFGASFISCYMAGMSYDYRLLFLAVSVLSFCSLVKLQEVNIKGLHVLLLVTLWFSGSFLPSTSLVLSGFIQLTGDIAMVLFVASFFVIGFFEVKSKFGLFSKNSL